jgi:hypothetical protein
MPSQLNPVYNFTLYFFRSYVKSHVASSFPIRTKNFLGISSLLCALHVPDHLILLESITLKIQVAAENRAIRKATIINSITVLT